MGAKTSHHHETDNTKVIQDSMLKIAELDKEIDESNKLLYLGHNIQVGWAEHEAKKKRTDLYLKCLKSIQTMLSEFRETYDKEQLELAKIASTRAPTRNHAWGFFLLNNAEKQVCYPTAQDVYDTLQRKNQIFDKAKAAIDAHEDKELAKPRGGTKPSGPVGKQA